MKVKSRVKSRFIVGIFIAILGGGSIAYGAEIDKTILDKKIFNVSDFYEYPLTPEDSEWLQLTVEERVEACRISESKLKKMSDEQLIQAIIDFPFLYDVFLYSNEDDGVKAIEKISDAYAELISRDSAKNSLIGFIDRRYTALSTTTSAEEELKNESLAALIAYQDKFQDNLTLNDMKKITSVSTMIGYKYLDEYENSNPYATSTPKTPNGKAVPYSILKCNHSSSDFHATLDQSVVEEYAVSLVSSGTCKYNCHSYAWHSQSTSNIYWINDPSLYMTDGSYNKVLGGINAPSLNAIPGDKLFYGTNSNPTHTAIITSSASGAPLGSRTVTSKWGKAGVFRHTAAAVPSSYDILNLSVWRR